MTPCPDAVNHDVAPSWRTTTEPRRAQALGETSTAHAPALAASLDSLPVPPSCGLLPCPSHRCWSGFRGGPVSSAHPFARARSAHPFARARGDHVL